MAHVMGLLLFSLTFGQPAAGQPVPPDLTALLKNASIPGNVTSWCRGEFVPRRSGAFAIAIDDGGGRGRYGILDPDGVLTELAPFSGGAEVQCYTPAEARKQRATIRRSETIEGKITPRWRTTVVCGFVENTHAECWQYSPMRHVFVKIGGWIT